MTTKKNEADICPICLMPKAATETGSVTQWISLCRCGTDLPQLQERSLHICRDCGKPLAESSDGSFTQWVVSASTCVCRHPDLIGIPSRPKEIESISVEDDDETELELSQEHLPLDRYKPIRVLGVGGAGKVYLCRDRLLNIRVAVKILRVQSNEQLVSFQQEAKAISKLTHPSIIQILNFGVTDDGRPYMVLEYINGISLSQMLSRNGPLDEDAAIDLFALVAAALGYANSMGVFHRDLKPSNILVTNSSPAEVRIIDFGIAKTISQNAQAKSQGKALVGTPAYMSPDQINNLSYDSRSEVYSFGCVLFEALAGRPPFQSDLALDLLSKHSNDQPPEINEISGHNDVSEEIQAIVSKCLMKQPDDRYQSLHDVAQQLTYLRPGNVKENQSPAPVDDTAKPPQAPLVSRAHLIIFSIVAVAIICGTISIVFLYSTAEQKQYRASIKPPEAVSVNLLAPPEIKKAVKSGIVSFDLYLYPRIDDDAFKGFEGADKVTDINASDQPISDKALDYLKGLKKLHTLNLSDTKVKTLTALSGLTNLASLNLNNTAVNDASLASLKNLKKLKYLQLKGTKVTARGLEHLVHLPSLIEVSIDLPSKMIGCEDIGYLSATYPDCKFLYTPAIGQSLWQEAARSFGQKDYQTALARYGYTATAFRKQNPKAFMVLMECSNKSADCLLRLGKPMQANMHRAAALKYALESKDFEHIRIAHTFWIGGDLEQRNYLSADTRSHEFLKWLKTYPNTQKFRVEACNQMLGGYSAIDGYEKQKRFWYLEKLAATKDPVQIAITTGSLAGCQKKLGEKAASLSNFEKAARMFEHMGPASLEWRAVVGLYADYSGSEADRGNIARALELNANAIKYTKNQNVPKDIKVLLLRTRIDYLQRANKVDEAARVRAQLDRILH